MEWVRNFSSGNPNNATSVVVDNSGNIITYGYFTSVTDFDPGPNVFNLSPAGATDLYISKLDANGNFIWAIRMGGSQFQYSEKVAVDALGNIYITGRTMGVADFDPGPGVFNLTSNGNYDIFIAKYNPSGGLVWAHNMGDWTSDFGRALTVDAAGNVYVTGDFAGTIDFDPGPGVFNLSAPTVSTGSSTHYLREIFIFKLNTLGQFVWAKKLNKQNLTVFVSLRPTSITVDASGNIYTAGYFNDTLDFDPGPGSFIMEANGGLDLFLLKLNASGDFLWAKQWNPNILNNFWVSVAIGPNNEPVLAARFSGTADFDPGPGVYNLTANPSINSFLLKLSASGNFLWAKAFEGGTSQNYSLAIDNNNQIYATGDFWGSIDFDPGPGNYVLSSSGAAYVAKLNSAGNFSMAVIIADGSAIGKDIKVDNGGNIYTCGDFFGSTNFGPSQSTHTLSSGDFNSFIHKLSQCPVSAATNINATACNSYTSPSGSQVYTASGIYTDIIQLPNNCDSLIQIDLTILNPSFASVNVSACNIYQSPSGKYTFTSSGTYMDTLINSAGCDSIITINLNVIQNLSSSFQLISPGCEGSPNTITYTGNASSAAVFTWDFDGGIVISGSGSGPFLVSWPSSGIMQVSLSVSEGGCNAPMNIQPININPLPSSDFSVTDSICMGNLATITYTGNAGPGASFAWDFDGGTINSGTGPGPFQVSWPSQGVKNISLSVSEAGCVSSVTINSIQVFNNPVATFTVNDSICSGSTANITFTGNASGQAVYNWQVNGAVTVSGSGPGPLEAEWDNQGVYTINLSILDNGCSAYYTKVIHVVAIPAVTILPQEPMCTKQTPVHLMATPPGGVWSGTGIADTVSGKFEPSIPGIGKHTIFYSSPGKCSRTASFHIQVDEVKAVFSFNLDTCLKKLMVENHSVGTGTYHWLFGDGTTSEAFEPEHYYSSNGAYKLTMVKSPGTACADTSEALLTIAPTQGGEALIVPNVFSPNGDGLNDFFEPTGQQLCNKFNHLAIYNRWGQLLFETRDSNLTWDGNSNGKPVVEGVYYYILSGHGLIKQGNITLFR
jgi:gliding motility-associated-like protein